MAVLLVGRYDGRKFKFAGKVTQGLRGMSRLELVAPEKLRLARCPFVDLPNRRVDHFGEGVTAEEMVAWIKPEVSVQVAFNSERPGAMLFNQLHEGDCFCSLNFRAILVFGAH